MAHSTPKNHFINTEQTYLAKRLESSSIITPRDASCVLEQDKSTISRKRYFALNAKAMEPLLKDGGGSPFSAAKSKKNIHSNAPHATAINLVGKSIGRLILTTFVERQNPIYKLIASSSTSSNFIELVVNRKTPPVTYLRSRVRTWGQALPLSPPHPKAMGSGLAFAAQDFKCDMRRSH